MDFGSLQYQTQTKPSKKHARAKIFSMLGLICILGVRKQRESVFCYVKSNLQQISYIPVKFLCEKSNWARRTTDAHSAQILTIWLQIDHRAKNPYMVADNRELSILPCDVGQLP